MKYIKFENSFVGLQDKDASSFKKDELFDAEDAGVVAYLAAQADEAQAQADEAQAIKELTKELLGDKLSKRIGEIQAAHGKRRKT
jgi:hypothetical protein